VLSSLLLLLLEAVTQLLTAAAAGQNCSRQCTRTAAAVVGLLLPCALALALTSVPSVLAALSCHCHSSSSSSCCRKQCYGHQDASRPVADCHLH
jgi:hypothetical protein